LPDYLRWIVEKSNAGTGDQALRPVLAAADRVACMATTRAPFAKPAEGQVHCLERHIAQALSVGRRTKRQRDGTCNSLDGALSS
jgi:hypothetical protein